MIAERDRGDDADVGGVEDVLVANAHEEFAADRDDRGECKQVQRICAQKQRQRQRRYDRTQRVEAFDAREPAGRKLGACRRNEYDRRGQQAYVETEHDNAEREQGAQNRDLVVARVDAKAGSAGRRCESSVHARYKRGRRISGVNSVKEGYNAASDSASPMTATCS